MKKYVFNQSCSIFGNDILTAVNSSYKDILNFSEKVAEKSFIEGLKKKEKLINRLIKNSNGFVICDKDLDYAVILWLKDFGNKWEYFDILNHEITHIVYFVSRQKSFDEEKEAQAYLHDYLFREIRRKLFNRLDREKDIKKKEKKRGIKKKKKKK